MEKWSEITISIHLKLVVGGASRYSMKSLSIYPGHIIATLHDLTPKASVLEGKWDP